MTGIDDLNERMKTSNGLQVMNLSVALAQSSQLNNITRLQREANQISRETKQNLEDIHSDLIVGNDWLEQVSRSTAANTKELKQLNEQVNATNRLLREQLQGIQSVKSSIDRFRFESAWQNFSNWIQTPNGKIYQEWTKQATDMVDTMGSYTKRMNNARKKDLKTIAGQMLVNLPAPQLETYAPTTPKPVKPVHPKLTNPGPAPKTRRLLYSKLSMIIIPILGFLIGTAYGYVSPTEKGRQLYEGLHNLTPLGWNMIANGIFGLAIGLFVAIIIYSSFDSGWLSKHVHEPEYPQWKQATIDYQRNLDHIRSMDRQYEKQLAQWEAARRNVEIRNQQKTDDYANAINQLPEYASGLLPAPTCWTVEDPTKIAKQISDLMDHSFVFPPADMSILPDPSLPVFAMPDSLPETAHHMKAVLARILEENRDNPDAKVAFGQHR